MTLQQAISGTISLFGKFQTLEVWGGRYSQWPWSIALALKFQFSMHRGCTQHTDTVWMYYIIGILLYLYVCINNVNYTHFWGWQIVHFGLIIQNIKFHQISGLDTSTGGVGEWKFYTPQGRYPLPPPRFNFFLIVQSGRHNSSFFSKSVLLCGFQIVFNEKSFAITFVKSFCFLLFIWFSFGQPDLTWS